MTPLRCSFKATALLTLMVLAGAGCEGGPPAGPGRHVSPSVSSPSPARPPGGPVPAQLRGQWVHVFASGRLILTLEATTYTLLTHGSSSGDVVVNGDEIDLFDAQPCDVPLPGGVGRYRWTLAGNTLQLTPLAEDPCPRGEDLANLQLTRG